MHFRVNDALGNKIGSVERVTDFSDVLSDFLAMRAVINVQRTERVFEYANRILDELSFILSQLESFNQKESGIKIDFAKSRLIQESRAWYEANKVMQEPKTRNNARKLEKHLDNVLMPAAKDLGSVLEVFHELLRVLHGLDYIFSSTHELLFVYNNASVDRLETRGYFNLNPEDQIIKKVEEKYVQATDRVLDIHNESIEIINQWNAEQSFEQIIQDFSDFEKEVDALKQIFDQAIVAIDAREQMAIKFLETQIGKDATNDFSFNLDKLAKLHQEGLLSEEEFNKAKAKLFE